MRTSYICSYDFYDRLTYGRRKEKNILYKKRNGNELMTLEQERLSLIGNLDGDKDLGLF